MNWNAIRAHRWSDADYQNGIEYLQSNGDVFPLVERDGKKVPLSDKGKYNFKQKMKYYRLNERGEIVLIDENCNHRTVHKVFTKEQIYELLKSYRANELTVANNEKSLYAKVIANNIIGVTRDDVKDYLKRQDKDIKLFKAVTDKPYVKSYRPNYPYEHWQIDFIDLPKLWKHNFDHGYILVIMDIFSKYIYLFPVEGNNENKKFDKKKFDNVAQILHRIFLYGDIPEKLGGDQEFKNNQMKAVCDKFGVKLLISAPYSPQTQGFVENKNKQIKGYINYHFQKRNPVDKRYPLRYIDILDHVAFSINNTQHSITKVTPMELHRGRALSIKSDFEHVKEAPLSLEQPDYDMSMIEEDVLSKDYVKTHDAYLRYKRKLVKSQYEDARAKIHKAADKRESDIYRKPEFSINQRVQVHSYIERDKGQIQPVILILVKPGYLQKDSIIKTYFKSDFEKYYTVINPLYWYKSEEEEKKKKHVVTIKFEQKTLFPNHVLKSQKFEWKISPGLPEPANPKKKRVVFLNDFILESYDKKTKTYSLIYRDGSNDYEVFQMAGYDKPNREYFYTRNFRSNIILDVPGPVKAEVFKPEQYHYQRDRQHIDITMKEKCDPEEKQVIQIKKIKQQPKKVIPIEEFVLEQKHIKELIKKTELFRNKQIIYYSKDGSKRVKRLTAHVRIMPSKKLDVKTIDGVKQFYMVFSDDKKQYVYLDPNKYEKDREINGWLFTEESKKAIEKKIASDSKLFKVFQAQT